MPLNDAEVQKQINHMIAFIEQEANEKFDEINAKTEEEYNIEKGRLIQQQRQQVMEYYEKKEKEVELEKKIQRSNAMNQARLRVLNVREENFRSVLDDVRRRLSDVTRDPARYKIVLEKLIVEALYHTMESKVVLRCRQADQSLVEEVIGSCADQYKTNIGKDVSIVVDSERFLPAASSGGIELLALNGRIKTTNTLESRLELISHELIPEIRTALFGKNPNRKYFH